MITFFKKKGPFDINYLIKCTKFTKPQKIKNAKIFNICSLENAKKNELTFFDQIKYLDILKNSKASYCLIREKHLPLIKDCTFLPIISEKPLLDFILISKVFYPDADNDFFDFKINKKFSKYIKQNTFIDKTVSIGKNFQIGFNSFLKKNLKIGNNVKIGSNCVISNTVIGDNVIINDGTVIGKVGYGFKFLDNKRFFIPHIGSVILGNNVYIGSNCTIDRGSFNNTIIKDNSMLDNQVHIAHNVHVGSNCFIAGQVGIAGSTFVGDNCLIGGQAGISGHLRVVNNCYIAGCSGVVKNLEDNSKVMGYPAVSLKDFIKRSINIDR